MDAVALPLDLEQFATEAVATGGYRDTAEVVAAGLRLLRRQEKARADLLASVLASQEEAERNGYLTGDELLERVEARLARRAATAT